MVGSNGLIVVDMARAFIVDTPWSEEDTKRLVTWARENKLQIIGSVSTHSHEDRTAGIEWLNSQSIPTFASDLTNSILAAQGRPTATSTLIGDQSSLAGGLLEVFYPGEGHTDDNLVVWLPGSNLLYGGCLIRNLGAKSLGFTGEATISEWANSVNKVAEKYPQVEVVIPGHGELGDAQLLEHTKNLAKVATEHQNSDSQ